MQVPEISLFAGIIRGVAQRTSATGMLAFKKQLVNRLRLQRFYLTEDILTKGILRRIDALSSLGLAGYLDPGVQDRTRPTDRPISVACVLP